MKNCNNCVFFECRKKQDLFMWIVRAPHGPSIKFRVLNGSFKLLLTCFTAMISRSGPSSP
jgi:hypothetical protein